MASSVFAATAPRATITLGLIGSDLPHQKWRAGLAFVALRRAVPRRPALDDVRDVDFFAPQAHGFDHVVEQLSGAADERFALLVFVGARRFADEHQLGMRIAHAEDNLLAPLLGQAAAGAVADIFADSAKGQDWIGNR